MITKDWIKKNRKDILSWSKKRGEFWKSISIYHNRTWEVELVDFNDKKVTSPVILGTYYFKTKPQALAYAKEYMEEH